MATTYKLRTDAEMTERPPQGFAVLFWGYDTGLADGTPALRILMPDGTFSNVNDNAAITETIKNKVDKKEGFSLIADTEITRLAQVNNYDDTTIKQDIETLRTDKADASALANYTTTADLQRDYATKEEIADVTKQGNTFNTAGKLVQLNDQGKIPETLYEKGGGGSGELPADVTRQGNEFNIANKLVKLDAQAKIPAELYDQPDTSKFVTQTELGEYLKSADASTTYATKAELGDINAILDAINGEVI